MNKQKFIVVKKKKEPTKIKYSSNINQQIEKDIIKHQKNPSNKSNVNSIKVNDIQNYQISKGRSSSLISKPLKNTTPNIKISRFINGTIGLNNIGNTCYINSAIQNLKNVYPLTLYLLSNYINYDQNGFTFKYCKLIANLINQDTYKFFEPREFFSKLNELIPIFRFGEQNDSNFCIIYILNLLEKETKNDKINFCKRNINFNNEIEKNKFQEFQNKLHKRRNSTIIKFFYGFQKDIYECQNCSYNNYIFQGFSVLNLPIMNKDNKQINCLKEAIKYYQAPQYHNKERGFYCPGCNNNIIKTQSLIISCPEFLIINLKRIGENKFYSHKVDFPLNLIINENDKYEIKYELIGYIKQIEGGNSEAICKNFFDDIWYIYDDSVVTDLNNNKNIINKSNVIDLINNQITKDSPNAFLFFYKKEELKISENIKEIIINKSRELRK